MGMIQIYNKDGYSSKKEATEMATFDVWDRDNCNYSCYGSLTTNQSSHTVTFSGAPLEVLSKECVEHYVKELLEFFPMVTVRIFEEQEVESKEALTYLKKQFRGNYQNKPTLFVTSQIDNKEFWDFFGGSERGRVMRLMYHTFLRAFHTYHHQLQKAWVKYCKDNSKSLMTWYMWFAATDHTYGNDTVYLATEQQGGGHSFRHVGNQKVPASAQQLIANCYLRSNGVNNSFAVSACINVPKEVFSK